MSLRCVVRTICAAVAVLTAAPVTALELAGQTDPAFQRSVDLWLDGQELTALVRLDRLARDGSTAARMLLGRLSEYQGPEVLRRPYKERAQFYRASPADGRGFPGNWVGVLRRQDHPLAVAMLDAYRFLDHDKVVAALDVLLRWGERERFLSILENYAANREPATLLLAEEIVTVTDFHQAWFWAIKWFAKRTRELGLRHSSRNRWPGEPWTSADDAAYRKALAQGRLSALIFDDYKEHFLRKTPEKARRSMVNWSLNPNYRSFRPSHQELEEFGRLLAGEARHGGFLRPLAELCRTNCPNTVAMCMASGVAEARTLRVLAWSATPVEVVIPQERWLGSRQARVMLIQKMRRVGWKPFALAFPNQPAQYPLPANACLSELLVPEPGAPGK